MASSGGGLDREVAAATAEMDRVGEEMDRVGERKGDEKGKGLGIHRLTVGFRCVSRLG